MPGLCSTTSYNHMRRDGASIDGFGSLVGVRHRARSCVYVCVLCVRVAREVVGLAQGHSGAGAAQVL